jgi:hypothetical protein
MLLSILLSVLSNCAAPLERASTPADLATSRSQDKGGDSKSKPEKKPAAPERPAPPKDEKTKDDKKSSAGPDTPEALLAKLGLKKTADGDWLTDEEQQKLKDGWTRQDLEWVSPDEADKVKEGLWKCGDQWLPLDQANEYHSKIGQWWRLRGQHYDVYTTLKRDSAMKAISFADFTHDELARIFGVTPPLRPIVLVLNSADQYNTFATGEQNDSPDLRGFSSSHGAFFAENWREPLKHGYSGAGVAYWDEADPKAAPFGGHYIRHAAAQSYAEALDPSLKPPSGKSRDAKARADEFWDQKKFPQWLRYGAATYVERYYVDKGGPDPKAMLKWSVANITSKGTLDPLKKIFGFEFEGNPDTDAKLMNECGLMVAFVVDGGNKGVNEKHEALKAAIKADKNMDKASTALADEIKKNEVKLREFAGL